MEPSVRRVRTGVIISIEMKASGPGRKRASGRTHENIAHCAACKSSWKQDDIPDHDRPLKGRGKRDARALGLHLLEQELIPQLIICSTAKRARQTAKLMAEAAGFEGRSRWSQRSMRLARWATFRRCRALTRATSACSSSVTTQGLVLLEVLTGEAHWLTTAALACIELPISAWPETQEYVGGRLVGLWSPKQGQGNEAGTL